ncbi:MAG: signal peptidase II [Candidatus Caenarcaniphilales bacterium]|nr:signal peptidase II [Candidatus Caenarcaniphilales bacterium]
MPIMIVILILAIALDQLTKLWARMTLVPGVEHLVIPQVLSWELAFNTGAAFSVFSGHTFWLMLVSAFVTVILLIHSWRIQAQAGTLYMACLAFLIAGAGGNLIDRVIFQRVTDFINLLILPGNFPIFNVADICINIAVALFLVDSSLNSKLNQRKFEDSEILHKEA